MVEYLPGSPQDVPERLLARGERVVTAERLAELLGVTTQHAVRRLRELNRDGRMLAVANGLWAPVSAERAAAGSEQPGSFIDALMTVLGRRYCLAYRTAAAVHGSSYHALSDLQVAVEARLRSRQFGATWVQFVHRRDLAQLPTRTRRWCGETVQVTTPEATVFDLVHRPDLALSMDYAATLIGGLLNATGLDGRSLAAVAPLYPRAVARRVGFVVEFMSAEVAWAAERLPNMDPLAAIVEGSPRRPVRLIAASSAQTPSTASELSLNERWGVLTDRPLEYSV